MAKMLPSSRPQWSRVKVLQTIAANSAGIRPTDRFALLAVRGYYRDSMGQPGANDRAIYDDAFFLTELDPAGDGFFRSYNANTDPSRFRPGIATLCPGVHRYKKGLHGISRPNPYLAFRPATKDEALPVTRDGDPNPRPGIAINIHCGSYNSTSSEGCQTLPPDQWAGFRQDVLKLMAKHSMDTFPYVLIEQQG